MLSELLSSGLRDGKGVNLVAYDKWNCVWIKDVNTFLITITFNLIFWLAYWICQTPLWYCVVFESGNCSFGQKNWSLGDDLFHFHILHFICFNLVGYNLYQTSTNIGRGSRICVPIAPTIRYLSIYFFNIFMKACIIWIEACLMLRVIVLFVIQPQQQRGNSLRI